MATYVLIHRAGDSSQYWHLVAPMLEEHGHDVVAQSFGGFPAPLVCARVPVRVLVLVAGMVPLPGETGEDWPAPPGFGEAAAAAGTDFADTIATFHHDVPRAVAEEAMRHARRRSDRPGRDPWPLAAWPDVPTRYLLCTDDRLFPAGWMRGVVERRLGMVPDGIASGHRPALGRPAGLVTPLIGFS
jgi:Alpha/beta hydrolase family